MGVTPADEQLAGRLVAGVDTHADAHWLCVIDADRRVVPSREFAADADGYAALADAIGDPEGCAAVGVEGTQPYGAGLTDELRRRGFLVLEVLRPKRGTKRARGGGEDDGIDAERAARDVVAGKVTSVPKARGGWVDDLRSLLVARDHAVDGMTSAAAAAESMVTAAPEGERARWRGLDRAAIMRRAKEIDEGETSALLTALRSLAQLWDLARRQADGIESRMREAVAENCPSMFRVYGAGTVTAAELAVSAGENPKERFDVESKFAKHCGVAPIPASSGRTSGRMRPDRGGDRRANKATHQIVLTRLAHDEETKAYVERRMRGDGGKRPISKKDAIRNLKRYVSREVYRALTHPFGEPKPRRGEASGQSPEEARLLAGLTQREVAAAVGISTSTLSKIECGKISGRSKSARKYAR